MEELSNEDRLFYSLMRKKEKENILFLCIGNTCRSIMAEAIMKKETKHNIYSAGINAKKDPISENTIKILNENNLEVPKKVSTHIDDLEDIRFDRIILLDENIEDKRNLKSNFLHKRYIEDPYGKDINKYRETFKEIVKITKKIT